MTAAARPSLLEQYPLDVDVTAERMRVSRSAVDVWMRSGVPVNGKRIRLANIRLGRIRRTSAEAIEVFIRECTAAGGIIPGGANGTSRHKGVIG